jgi:8-oxo-dGTP pyrophosphatase MutT (NUDIX family)
MNARFAHSIHHDPGLERSGAPARRQAVRAVIPGGGRLLMIYAPDKGEYKFPGGGVEAGEEPAAALVREIREEAGAEVTRIVRPIGRVSEDSRDRSGRAAYFLMVSDYYLAEIGTEGQALHLDEYEAELGFTPRWISLADAIAANVRRLAEAPDVSRWIRRETWVLHWLADHAAGFGLDRPR